jgi:hypothetical protein
MANVSKTQLRQQTLVKSSSFVFEKSAALQTVF